MPTALQTIGRRIGSESRRFVERLSGATAALPGLMFKAGPPKTRRLNRYTDADLRDLLYEGNVYRPYYEGGALEDIIRSLGYGGDDAHRYTIRNHYNAVHPIVTFYRNAFGGRLGNDIEIADEVNDKPVDEQTKKLTRQVWQWSNLDHRSEVLTTLGANQGRVGIRIVYEPGPPARAFLDFDDRRSIQQVDRDSRGNVVNVRLRYMVRITDENGVATMQTAEEIIGKDEFSLTYDGQQQLDDEQRANPLGICPYVVVDHDAFARHAYAGSEDAMHGINFGLSRLDDSTIQHVWPYLFATSAGAPPAAFKVDQFTLLYSQTKQGFPEPSFNPMVPTLDFTAFIAQIKARVDFLRERQPQLILNSLSLLSGISGETLQQVLKPAEAESQRARVLYEDGVRRALQIAMSIGIASRMPGFDLGTGTGTADAADRAYGDGEGPEAFAFKDRPALPPTVAQVQAQATADNADANAKLDRGAKAQRLGLAQKTVLRDHVGMTEKQIQADTQDRGDEATLPTEEPIK